MGEQDFGERGAYPGMTLRDYFAAKAMQGLLARNGACHPADAYDMADAMLEARSPKAPPVDPILAEPILYLQLSTRAENCLKDEKIGCIGDLIQRTERDLACILRLGRKSLNEIKEALASHGLTLTREA